MKQKKPVLIGAAAFLGGAVLSVAGRRVRRRFSGKRRAAAQAASEVFPLSPVAFRNIVAMAAAQRAEKLTEQLGTPLKFASQDGEDVLLGELFGHKREGYFIEIGAFDGVWLSNTYFFEQLGWTGVLVEPLPDQYEACRVNRPRSRVVNAAVGSDASGTIEIKQVVGQHEASGESLGTFSYVRTTEQHLLKVERLASDVISHQVPFRTFDAIAEEVGLKPNQPIDVLSIDCEGMDFEVLKSVDLTKYQPRILILESSDGEVVSYLRAAGYEPLIHIKANTIFSNNPEDAKVLTANRYWEALGLH